MSNRKKLITIALAPLLAILIVLFLVNSNLLLADFGKDFQTNGTVLVKYNGTDSSVVVPEGITKIEANAFSNNPLIENVTIPNSVTKIGDSAFADCINLTSVSLPDSVDSIGESCFSRCGKLKDVKIGNRLSIVGSGAFAGCKNLSNIDVSLDNNFFVCKDGVLYSKDMKKLYAYLAGNKNVIYYMPNEVEELARYSFFDAGDLKCVITSNALKKVNDYAFFNMPDLESVVINTPVNAINMGAFQNCPNLKQVVMPESVVTIYANSFASANKDLTFICNSNSYAYKFAGENNIKVSQTPIIEIAKYSNTDNSVSGNNTDNTNAEDVYEEVASEESLNINTNIDIADDYIRSIGGTTIVSDKAFVILDDLYVFNNDTNNANETDKTIIPDYAFYCSSIEGFSFEDYPVKTIGKLSFARSGLNSIIIPETVKTIGYGAFYHCDSLTDIIIPSSVNRIDAYAFDYTPFYNNFLSSGEDFLILGDGVLVKYNGTNENVLIPDNVKYISTYAFKDNDYIKSVQFNNGLLIINDYAFNNCINLESVSNIPSACILSDKAFSGCNIR